MITYSTSSPVMPAFCRAAEMAIPPRSTAGMSLREPDNLPIGVRAPPTMTDPGIVRLLLSFRLVKIRDRAVECLGRHAYGLRQCRMRVHIVPHQVPSQVTGRGGRSSAPTSQSSRHWQVPDRRPGLPSMSNADLGHRPCAEGEPT